MNTALELNHILKEGGERPISWSRSDSSAVAVGVIFRCEEREGSRGLMPGVLSAPCSWPVKSSLFQWCDDEESWRERDGQRTWLPLSADWTDFLFFATLDFRRGCHEHWGAIVLTASQNGSPPERVTYLPAPSSSVGFRWVSSWHDASSMIQSVFMFGLFDPEVSCHT